jgi:hypothetical protein
VTAKLVTREPASTRWPLLQAGYVKTTEEKYKSSRAVLMAMQPPRAVADKAAAVAQALTFSFALTQKH